MKSIFQINVWFSLWRMQECKKNVLIKSNLTEIYKFVSLISLHGFAFIFYKWLSSHHSDLWWSEVAIGMSFWLESRPILISCSRILTEPGQIFFIRLVHSKVPIMPKSLIFSKKRKFKLKFFFGFIENIGYSIKRKFKIFDCGKNSAGSSA